MAEIHHDLKIVFNDQEGRSHFVELLQIALDALNQRGVDAGHSRSRQGNPEGKVQPKGQER
jgi:hypothetical protein